MWRTMRTGGEREDESSGTEHEETSGMASLSSSSSCVDWRARGAHCPQHARWNSVNSPTGLQLGRTKGKGILARWNSSLLVLQVHSAAGPRSFISRSASPRGGTATGEGSAARMRWTSQSPHGHGDFSSLIAGVLMSSAQHHAL